MTLIYGTGNPAKLEFMRKIVRPLGLELLGTGKLPVRLPEIDESGNDPLENARIKARAYWKTVREQTKLDCPVFSCDSGLYIEGLPEDEQPGVHVRRVNGKNLTDDGMVEYYAGLARRLGGRAPARYRNAICLVVSEHEAYESMGDEIASGRFLLADTPHPVREKGFPLNSLSVRADTGEYYNDRKQKTASNSADGFRNFFRRALCLNLSEKPY